MIRIAMWAGPRNLSTAMMRSFGSRSMSGARIDIGLRAAVFDWIQAGARGRDQDGNLASDVLFRDQLESERFQRYLVEPPP